MLGCYLATQSFALRPTPYLPPRATRIRGQAVLNKNNRYLALSLLVLLAALTLAPGLLQRSDARRKADAVVLYLGPEREARYAEARRLLREGYAEYLIIPSLGEVQRVQKDGNLRRISRDLGLGAKLLVLRKAASYRSHYENTHVETCEAKRIMDELRLRSALLVSSGYHMRRIGIIAGLVFPEERYAVLLNPARSEAPLSASDWFDEKRRQIICSEYLKLGWFLIYAPFAPGGFCSMHRFGSL